MGSEHIGRRHPVHHAPHDGGDHAAILFLTVCIEDRRPLLARTEAVACLRAAWQAADHWLVGRWVVLPDHLHLFCAPARRDALPLERWVRFWKSAVTRTWPWPEEKPLWQTDFWDTQLRIGDSYDGKWHYVRNNPVRHGLVARAEDWPFQGQEHMLRW